MPEATITSKGQVTLPKAVRDQLGLRTGDRIAFGDIHGNRVEITALTNSVTIDDLIGVLPRPQHPRTIDDMNAAVRRHARGKRGRT